MLLNPRKDIVLVSTTKNESHRQNWQKIFCALSHTLEEKKSYSLKYEYSNLNCNACLITEYTYNTVKCEGSLALVIV